MQIIIKLLLMNRIIKLLLTKRIMTSYGNACIHSKSLVVSLRGTSEEIE